MKVEIIPIGNSRGFRVPKAMLEQCGFEKSAELAVEAGHLIVRPARKVRQGWDAAFRQMADRREEELLDTLAPDFDKADWSW